MRQADAMAHVRPPTDDMQPSLQSGPPPGCEEITDRPERNP